MANLIYFVTDTILKDTTTIADNVDVKNFLPLVRTAADMYTRTTLGTYFYNYLLGRYNAGTLSADEITLVEGYIQPAVAWRVAADATIELSYQLKNKGVQKQSGDYSTSAEYKETMWVADHYAQKADSYENRLFQYVIENRALYPQFTDVLNKDSTAKNACPGATSPVIKNRIYFI